MGLFSGKLFDFDGDGTVDFGEGLLGWGAVGALMQAAEEEAAEETFDERESLLEDMESQMEEMEAEMPDPDSPEYEQWEAEHDDLEEEIDRLTDDLYD